MCSRIRSASSITIVKKLAIPTGTTQKTAISKKLTCRFSCSPFCIAMFDVSQSCTQYAPVRMTEMKIHAGKTSCDRCSVKERMTMVI